MKKTGELLKLGTCKRLRGTDAGEYFVAFRDADTVVCIPWDWQEVPTWSGPVYLWGKYFIVVLQPPA